MHDTPVWKILLVDDDEDDYFLTRSMLADVLDRRYELDWAASYALGRKALAENHYDAVLMDFDLGARSGLELTREATQAANSTPVILYTGRAGFEVDVQAMEAGAILYLAKEEATPRLLDRSIRYAIQSKQADILLQQQKAELEEKNRLLEELLAASAAGERRYRSLFEGMNEGFALHEIVLDGAGQPCDYRFLEINPAFERITSLSREQVIGRLMSEVLPGEDNRWINLYGPVALTGVPAHAESFSITLKKHYAVHAYCPEPMQFAVIFTDVTENKLLDAQRQQMVADLTEAMQAAESDHARLEAIFAAQTDVVLIYDASMTARRVNPAFEAAFGFDPRGLTVAQIVERVNCRTLDGRPLILSEQPTPRALRGDPVSGARFRVTRFDGSEIVVETSSSPMFLAGEIAGSVTVWHDITAQTGVEEHLRQSEELHRQTLENSRRYAARLETLNRELQDFTFIASHDLQEPLRKVLTFGQRLQEQAAPRLSEEEADYLDRMVSAAGRMRAMVQGLLAYSRVTTQSSPIAWVDLSETVAEALSDLEVSLESSQGRVEVGELPSVQADPLQMHQLFENLIGNALKFSRPGAPPHVRVWGQVLPPEREGLPSQARVFVEDNGIGFDPARIDRLFQPFHRLVSRSEFEGSGIGLAICRKIAERHNGSITAQSAPGQGATFIVTLPIEEG